MLKWRTIAGCILVVLLATTVVYAGTIRRTYRWEFQGEAWSLELSIPSELYHLFRDIPFCIISRIIDQPVRWIWDYSAYITDPRDDQFLGMLARRLGRAAQKAGFDEWERLNFVISFTQSLRYIPTYFRVGARYPVETLVHGSGECEDIAILTAALLHQMGHSVILLVEPGCITVGITPYRFIPEEWFWKVNDHRRYFLEITKPEQSIREVLREVPEKTRIIELTPKPYLELYWRSTRVRWCLLPVVPGRPFQPRNRFTYRVYVTVANRGSGRSVATQFSVVLETGYLWWRRREDYVVSDLFSLLPFSERTISFYLEFTTPPWPRIFVEVWSDNHLLITCQSR